MTAVEYQKCVKGVLQGIVAGQDMVREEWSTSRDAVDGFLDPARYAPRLDIAVGPFNITNDVSRNTDEIRAASDHPLIARIQDEARTQNGQNLAQNENPRCLLAIEIEFSGSSKHILGDFTNASMMGLIGIVVGRPQNIKKISRIREYVRWLQGVGKAPASLFGNVVVLETDQFLRLID